jgi:carbon-monoxide dehydrogenase medium subunit
MQAFTYHRPTELSDVVKILADCEDPKLLAGGMTLLPTLKQRLAAPSDLIDLARIQNLHGICEDKSEIVIGAMTCHADVAASAVVRAFCPALADLAGQIGDPAVRHRGTIGGSVANADPAADYPAAVLGLNAIIETNQRRIKADNFFTGLFETALEPGEIITALRFPRPHKAQYQKFRHPASGYAVVGVMVAQFAGATRLAITGAGPNAFRPAALEEALTRSFTAKALEGLQLDPDELLSDMHASAAYRAHVALVLAQRAVGLIA